MSRNDTLVESYEYAGQTIEIHTDFDPFNPRHEYDHPGSTVCIWHRRHALSDKGAPESPEAMVRMMIGELYNNDDKIAELEDMDWGAALAQMVNEFPKLVVQLIYMYDHSGITISTGSFSAYDPGGWDSGPVGFIYAMPKDVDKEWGGDPKQARECLESEIEEYDNYLTGQVYGYIINPDSNINNESCWGFNGKIEYVKQEAEAVAKSISERQNGQKTRRALLKVAVTYVSDPDVPEEKVLDGLYMKANLAMADVKDVTVEEIVATEDAE